MSTYDVIVVGLGAHGSSSVAHLSERGLKVLGLEKFRQGHTRGSSHGRSRIIRQAYFEDPRYVPLIRRSFQLWRILEEKSRSNFNLDLNLLRITGGLMIGSSNSDVVKGTLESARVHNLPHAVYTAEDILSMYKVFKLSKDEIGIFEEEAGYLIPENCLISYQKMAVCNGAELHFEEAMETYNIITDCNNHSVVEVRTNANKIYRANKIVLTVGAWAPSIYGDCLSKEIDLHVERRILYWLKPHDNMVKDFQNIPIYIWDIGQHENFYGFPTFDILSEDPIDSAVKVAMHHADEDTCTADTVNRDFDVSKEISNLIKILKAKIPSLVCNGENNTISADGNEAYRLIHSTSCLYTLTSNGHFIIDWKPNSNLSYTDNHILLVSACSGHGFKFASVIGEIVADLVINNCTEHDISLFRLTG